MAPLARLTVVLQDAVDGGGFRDAAETEWATRAALERLQLLERVAAAGDEVVADLCALAEEQSGNPHDELSARLYEIAHKIELAQTERARV